MLGLAAPACRRTVFDIVTSERVVRAPRSVRTTFTLDTRIELPSTLGVDKTVDSSTLDLTTTNFNTTNPVTVALSIADADNPGLFRPVVTYELASGETRQIRVVQTQPDDALVRATQTDALIIRFDSTSPAPGIGEIEFRFTVRVLAHKETPGTGAGTLLFY
jgi:hypothetical protein